MKLVVGITEGQKIKGISLIISNAAHHVDRVEVGG